MPKHVVAPMAGGSLISKLHKAFHELHKVRPHRRSDLQGLRRPGRGLQPGHRCGEEQPRTAQAGARPNTIAKSLAIGDPADGFFAAKVMRDTGG
ncbi:MAG: hypothetical protein U0744_07075 [Gemmataceae bacterium]